MYIDQDTATDIGQVTFGTWSIPSMTVAIGFAFDDQSMSASLLANDKGTRV